VSRANQLRREERNFSDVTSRSRQKVWAGVIGGSEGAAHHGAALECVFDTEVGLVGDRDNSRGESRLTAESSRSHV